MNRAHKHELERNVLADRIESLSSTVQPILPVVLGIVALVAVGSIVWGVYSSSVKRQQAAAWTEYFFNLSGGDAETYLDVAEAYPDSNMSGWARIAAGDNYLHKGIEALYRNRQEGEDNLQQAIDTYQEAVDSNEAELRAKALWGLAQAHESLGDLEQASDFYQRFTTTETQPEMLSAAAERLAFINSPSGKSFYNWFSQLDPKPDAPIELPGNLSLPPMTPDLQFDPLEAAGIPDLSAEGNDSELEAIKSQLPPIDPADLPNLDVTAPPAAGGQAEDINSLDLPPSESSGSESSGSESSSSESSGDGSDTPPALEDKS